MKNLVISILVSFSFMSNLFGQLPNGTVSPDWTGTDLNGTTHSLYADYLNQGVSVVIDISATWCSNCWSYHNSGAMDNMYNSYGPNGTGDCQVIFIEGDPSTSLQCLYGSSGCTGGTIGNWVGSKPYPFIHTEGPNIKNLMTIAGYPTVYLISAQIKKCIEIVVQLQVFKGCKIGFWALLKWQRHLRLQMQIAAEMVV